jgi:hypothetical protein
MTSTYRCHLNNQYDANVTIELHGADEADRCDIDIVRKQKEAPVDRIRPDGGENQSSGYITLRSGTPIASFSLFGQTACLFFGTSPQEIQQFLERRRSQYYLAPPPPPRPPPPLTAGASEAAARPPIEPP